MNRTKQHALPQQRFHLTTVQMVTTRQAKVEKASLLYCHSRASGVAGLGQGGLIRTKMTVQQMKCKTRKNEVEATRWKLRLWLLFFFFFTSRFFFFRLLFFFFFRLCYTSTFKICLGLCPDIDQNPLQNGDLRAPCFSISLVVRIWRFHRQGPGSIPGQRIFFFFLFFSQQMFLHVRLDLYMF